MTVILASSGLAEVRWFWYGFHLDQLDRQFWLQSTLEIAYSQQKVERREKSGEILNNPLKAMFRCVDLASSFPMV